MLRQGECFMSAEFPSVAIVGSGPSGCYVAQFLKKKWPASQITIFEALPVPYGLMRYGVAADHQGSKTVMEQFERMFSKGDVTFQGNVVVGRDVSYEKLDASFDVVVLATGLNEDAQLSIPIQPSAPVVGAGLILKALNGHPKAELPRQQDGTIRTLGSSVGVIGSGNVAVDLLRMIAKSDAEMAGSDICDEVRDALETRKVKTLTLISRSSASQAKCDGSMLAELLALPDVRVNVTGLEEGEIGQIATLLTAASECQRKSTGTGIKLEFAFNAVPCEIEEVAGRAHLTVEDAISKARKLIPLDTLVTAIGFDNARRNNTDASTQCLSPRAAYKVGWLKRGPIGTIADNRKDAKAVAEQIAADFEHGSILAGKLGLSSLIRELPRGVVSYEQWRRIDEHEQRQAKLGRCRTKITDLRTMLKVAHGEGAHLGQTDSRNLIEELA